MTDGSAVLITGANGWLGTQLVHSLRDGITDDPRFGPQPDRPIRCLVLPGSDPGSIADVDGVEVIEGDLTDRASLDAFVDGASGATLFHTAGVIHPKGRVAQFYAVNERGTHNILDAASKAKVRRFIHVSSNSPFGTNARAESFAADAPFKPYMHYGRSKRRGEELVLQAHAAGEVDAVIVRPPWFYGPNQPPRQTQFFRMIRDGKMPKIGGGTNRRSMAYTENIAQGMFLAERVPEASGRAYWIADRQPYEMREIVTTVQDVLEELGFEVRRKSLAVPGIVSEMAMFADHMLQGVGLYHQKIHVLGELNKNIACDITAAVDELGYDPKVELREGMRRSVRWLMDRQLFG